MKMIKNTYSICCNLYQNIFGKVKTISAKLFLNFEFLVAILFANTETLIGRISNKPY